MIDICPLPTSVGHRMGAWAQEMCEGTGGSTGYTVEGMGNTCPQ